MKILAIIFYILNIDCAIVNILVVIFLNFEWFHILNIIAAFWNIKIAFDLDHFLYKTS